MNERIQKLFQQACWDKQMEIHTADFINVEEFAASIVRECISQATAVQVQQVSNGSDDYNLGREMGIEVAINKIKQHFGVEQ